MGVLTTLTSVISRRRGQLILVGVHDRVESILSGANLWALFRILDTQDQALEYFLYQ